MKTLQQEINRASVIFQTLRSMEYIVLMDYNHIMFDYVKACIDAEMKLLDLIGKE